MTEAPHPFHQWVDAAQPRQQLWRTALGLALVAAIYMGVTYAILWVARETSLLTSQMVRSIFGEGFTPISFPQAVLLLIVLLASLIGAWAGVWAALKFVNKRPFSSVFAYNRRIDWRQFGIGGAIACGYLIFNIVWTIASGHAPARSDVELPAWLAALPFIAAALFIQTTGEELIFRGYLPQQLAARVPNPVVWEFLPTMAFGLLHAANGGADSAFAIYYVFAATLSGLVMMAMVWRTGSLAAGMGFHFVNNLIGFTVAGPASGASVSLFVWPQWQVNQSAPADLLILGLLLSFVLSPLAPLPKGQPLARRNETRAAP